MRGRRSQVRISNYYRQSDPRWIQVRLEVIPATFDNGLQIQTETLPTSVLDLMILSFVDNFPVQDVELAADEPTRDRASGP